MITGGFSRIVEHNYLTKSRGKQGYDEEDIFTLMMVYASKMVLMKGWTFGNGAKYNL